MKKCKRAKWENLPVNIQKAMIKNYIREYNYGINKKTIQRAIKDFKSNIFGGFFWDVSPDGFTFWANILSCSKYLISGNII